MSDQINNNPAYNEAWKNLEYHSGKFVHIEWDAHKKAMKQAEYYWGKDDESKQ